MEKSFTADVIMDYLCPKGIDGKKYDIIPLAKEYMPEGNHIERLSLQSMIQTLKNNEWIDVSKEQLFDLSTNRPTQSWEGRELKIWLNKTDYCDKHKQQQPTYNINIKDSYGFALFSHGTTIHVEHSKTTNILNDIRNAVIKEQNIDASYKNETISALDKVESEIKSGTLHESTFNSLLGYLSKFASIGSLAVNLAKYLSEQ